LYARPFQGLETFEMDFNIVVIINCGSISNEYLVMQAGPDYGGGGSLGQAVLRRFSGPLVSPMQTRRGPHFSTMGWGPLGYGPVGLFVNPALDAGYAAKRTVTARERRNCVIIGQSIPHTVLQAIFNVSSP
jgi:hypothetical protein